MEKFRIGIVGYGMRAKMLIPICSMLDNVELTAICDANTSLAAAIEGDNPGISHFRNYTEMLRSGLVDGVLIETPPQTHAAYSIEALEANIHVYCDVPAVQELSEVEELWKAGQRSRAIYMMGATTNASAQTDIGVDLKAKGLLGKPFYCEAEYVQDLGDYVNITPWRKYYEPIRYCTHSLGPILRWIEEDLAYVSCFDTGNHIHDGDKRHDAMLAIFRTKSNIVVKLLASFTNNHPRPHHRYVCHGTNGFFESTIPIGREPVFLFSTRQVTGMHDLTSLSMDDRPGIPAGLDGIGAMDYILLGEFVASAREGRSPSVSMEKALQMTLPGLYALESAKSGGSLIEIKYPWS